jgi:hypothetical protein
MLSNIIAHWQHEAFRERYRLKSFISVETPSSGDIFVKIPLLFWKLSVPALRFLQPEIHDLFHFSRKMNGFTSIEEVIHH